MNWKGIAEHSIALLSLYGQKKAERAIKETATKLNRGIARFYFLNLLANATLILFVVSIASFICVGVALATSVDISSEVLSCWFITNTIIFLVSLIVLVLCKNFLQVSGPSMGSLEQSEEISNHLKSLVESFQEGTVKQPTASDDRIGKLEEAISLLAETLNANNQNTDKDKYHEKNTTKIS